jgi:MFS family permease
MKWNAFDFVSPAIEKTKKRIFPFRFWEWFKLGIISGLAVGSRGFSGGSSGYQGGSSSSSQNISFEQFKSKIREIIQNYWIIGAFIIILFMILGFIWSYITSVFNFIFIECLVTKNTKFTFSKNSSKGASLFFFRLIFSILTFIVIILLAYPYISNFMKENPIISSVGWGYILFSILALIIYLLIIWFLLLFVYDFVTAFMYVKGTGAAFSWKQVWKVIFNNKKETFIYWAARLVLGIAVGIISVIIGFIVLLIFAFIGLVLFLIGFLLFKIFGGIVFFTILGILAGFILFVTFIVSMMIATLPFSVFTKYFQLLNFEKLTGIKIFNT